MPNKLIERIKDIQGNGYIHFLEKYGIALIALIFLIAGIVFVLSVQLPSRPDWVDWAKESVDKYGLIGVFIVSLLGASPIPLPYNFIIGGFAVLALHLSIPIILVAGVGTTLAGIFNFILARALGKSFVRKQIDKKSFKVFNRIWEKYGVFLLWINGISPVSIFDPLTLVAGLSNMSFKKYATITFISRTMMYFLTIVLTIIVKDLWLPFL